MTVVTYRALAVAIGAFSPWRRRRYFRRPSAGVPQGSESLKVWESEGGSLSKNPPVN